MSSLLPRFLRNTCLLATLRKNVELQIIEHLKFSHHVDLLSNLKFDFDIKQVDSSLLENYLNSTNISFALMIPELKTELAGKVDSNQEKNFLESIEDTHFVTYKLIHDNPSREVYDFHQINRVWWRRHVNNPFNLNEKITPNSCTISYCPNSNESDTKHIIEKSEIANISDSLAIIKNIKSLNTSVYTFLIDSNHSVDGYDFLRIHPKFAPIPISIIVCDEDQDMEPVVRRVLEDLHREHFRFELHAWDGVSTIMQQNDRNGVLFTVILDSTTVDKGVVRIRDRNTHFEEPVNIKNLIKWLKLNTGKFC